MWNTNTVLRQFQAYNYVGLQTYTRVFVTFKDCSHCKLVHVMEVVHLITEERYKLAIKGCFFGYYTGYF